MAEKEDVFQSENTIAFTITRNGEVSLQPPGADMPEKLVKIGGQAAMYMQSRIVEEFTEEGDSGADSGDNQLLSPGVIV